MKTLILLDFDGTITRKDSLFEFAKFCHDPIHFGFVMLKLIPTLLITKLGLMDKQRGKEAFLRYFFKGMKNDAFNRLCHQFCTKKLPSLIRPKAIHFIEEQHNNSSDIYIVSASPENWILPWANSLKIKVIASRLQVTEGCITGKLIGMNCNGQEKVKRILAQIDIERYHEIIAYGDSKGDLPMLELATVKKLNPFK